LPVESPPNPSTSNSKHHNRRRSKQPFIFEESPVDTMADQRIVAELLRVPTEGVSPSVATLFQNLGIIFKDTLQQPQLTTIRVIPFIVLQKMLKALLSNKEKLLELENTPLNENCSVVILKKLPKKLRDPGKFLISTTSFSSSSSPSQLLDEFADKLALITFPLKYDDDLPFDIKSDLKEIKYLLHHDLIKDIDSILKHLINQSELADLNNNLVDTMPEMFNDEHALDYSSPPLYKVDALPSTNNEDRVFNPGILIQENLFEIITRVAPEKNEKKLAISHASLILEDFDPPLYEFSFFKELK
nr:reverse transcriptase domain-containing protein [Tanacetum cinerariifolium]